MGTSILSFLAVIGLTGADYALFTAKNGSSQGCSINTLVITLNLLFSLLIILISILPKIQSKNSKSGLLQPCLLSFYTTYLVTSAISEDPYSCLNSTSTLSSGLIIFSQVIGISLTLIAIVYAAYSAGSEVGIMGGSKDPSMTEEDGPGYNYSWFHFIFVLASFYMASVLNNVGGFQILKIICIFNGQL